MGALIFYSISPEAPASAGDSRCAGVTTCLKHTLRLPPDRGLWPAGVFG